MQLNCNHYCQLIISLHIFPFPKANHLQHLISLLTPVYWTTAFEIEGAVNGYTLTGGEFMREVQVEFATGKKFAFDFRDV